MAGRKCPNCGNLTYFDTFTGGRCNVCGFEGTTSPLGGTGGKGRLCMHCGRYQVFNGKCRNCGTTYSISGKK